MTAADALARLRVSASSVGKKRETEKEVDRQRAEMGTCVWRGDEWGAGYALQMAY